MSVSSSIGQISTSCADVGCGGSNYQLYDATVAGTYTLGDLYGYAWSPAVGWISFNCNQTGVGGANTCATGNYFVTMNTGSGFLSGYAWNDMIGWISTNCNDSGSSCTYPYYVKVLFGAGGTPTAGSLTSQILDSQVANGVLPTTLVWQGMVYGGTIVNFQIATANSQNGPWNFIGPDGTGSSSYSGQPGSAIAVSAKYHANQRYLRYRVFLSGTAVSAPTINGIAITYAK